MATSREKIRLLDATDVIVPIPLSSAPPNIESKPTPIDTKAILTRLTADKPKINALRKAREDIQQVAGREKRKLIPIALTGLMTIASLLGSIFIMKGLDHTKPVTSFDGLDIFLFIINLILYIGMVTCITALMILSAACRPEKRIGFLSESDQNLLENVCKELEQKYLLKFPDEIIPVDCSERAGKHLFTYNFNREYHRLILKQVLNTIETALKSHEDDIRLINDLRHCFYDCATKMGIDRPIATEILYLADIERVSSKHYESATLRQAIADGTTQQETRPTLNM